MPQCNFRFEDGKVRVSRFDIEDPASFREHAGAAYMEHSEEKHPNACHFCLLQFGNETQMNEHFRNHTILHDHIVRGTEFPNDIPVRTFFRAEALTLADRSLVSITNDG